MSIQLTNEIMRAIIKEHGLDEIKKRHADGYLLIATPSGFHWISLEMLEDQEEFLKGINHASEKRIISKDDQQEYLNADEKRA